MRIASMAALAAGVLSLCVGAAPASGDSTEPFTNYLVTATKASPNRSVGRLVTRFRRGPMNEEACSAAVVHSQNRNTVITAGHCVYNKAKGGYAIDASFAPGVRDGNKPFGKWRALRFTAARPWITSGLSHYDFAFVTLLPERGRSVENVAGGLPIAFDQPRDQNYHVLGYPVVPSPPYDGTKLWACDAEYRGDVSDSTPQYGPPVMYTNCDFNRGSSGGPWLNEAGQVSSVTSTVFPTSPNSIGGPYLGDDAAALFRSVQSIRPGKSGK